VTLVLFPIRRLLPVVCALLLALIAGDAPSRDGGGVADAAAVVLVGAGDIAGCNGAGDEATAALLDGIPGTVVTVGDNVYESGTAAEFASCYDPSWGRFKARTRPAVGNHEYLTANAAVYFGLFCSAAGYPA
jgi:hypothetical protein